MELSPDVSTFLERLECLKELSDQQRLLSRAEGRVEQSYEVVQECNKLIEGSKREIDLLKCERKRLVERIWEIDQDLAKLLDLTESLTREKSHQYAGAPLSEYSQLLNTTNLQRAAMGQLLPLNESSAFTFLQGSGDAKWDLGKSCTSLETSLDSAMEVKAGRSHKLCPCCFKRVSRNATSCPYCMSVCAKTCRPK